MALKSGDKVIFEERSDGFLLRKARDIFELRGCLGPAIPQEQERSLMEKGVADHAAGQEK